ncbi:MAG: riboflavin synthase, partial [Pseudomonadota bacterium]|nr:riboflavin synthase [Pseudomonadota bacterium]
VEGDTFGVNLISHTQNVTNWGVAQVCNRVNLEIDVLARYVARLKDTEGDANV